MTISQTPKWFIDFNYDFIENLDLNGWHIQLIERERFKLDKIIKPDLTDCQLWEAHLERIKILAENPNYTTRQRTILHALYQISPFHAPRDEDDEADEYDRYLYVNLNAPDKIILGQFKSWLKEVRKQAKAPGKKSGIGPDDLVRWKHQRILQLIDLLTYKELTGEIRSVESMYDWLYDDFDPGESVKSYMYERRKTLMKAKRQILSMAFQPDVGDI